MGHKSCMFPLGDAMLNKDPCHRPLTGPLARWRIDKGLLPRQRHSQSSVMLTQCLYKIYNSHGRSKTESSICCFQKPAEYNCGKMLSLNSQCALIFHAQPFLVWKTQENLWVLPRNAIEIDSNSVPTVPGLSKLYNAHFKQTVISKTTTGAFMHNDIKDLDQTSLSHPECSQLNHFQLWVCILGKECGSCQWLVWKL